MRYETSNFFNSKQTNPIGGDGHSPPLRMHGTSASLTSFRLTRISGPRRGDLLLAREGLADDNPFGLLKRIEREGAEVLVSRLKRWKNGKDVYSTFEAELGNLVQHSS